MCVCECVQSVAIAVIHCWCILHYCCTFSPPQVEIFRRIDCFDLLVWSNCESITNCVMASVWMLSL